MMKILVIQQKKIGDVLTSTILFEALRQKYPKAELHYLVNSHTLPVVENNPFINKVVNFTTEMQKNKRIFYAFLKTLKAEHYDIVIDVYVKISSNLITYFSKADTRIGYYKYYSAFVYNQTVVPLKKPEHNCSLAVENRLKLLEPLGIPFQNISPKLYVKETEFDAAKTVLLNSKINFEQPLVMVSILGSIPQKTYPKAYMAKLLDYCVYTFPEIQLLFNYIPTQHKAARFIYEQTSSQTQDRIFFNIFGKSLREFMALTANCDAMIGNEGGGNNMAKALNIPTFTIFSPVIDRKAWFGHNETTQHAAVHPAEQLNFEEKDHKKAKKNPRAYYAKFKPELIFPALTDFMKKIVDNTTFKKS